MQIRIQGTPDEIEKMIESLYYNYGDGVENVSKHYADRNGKTYRVYVEIKIN